MRPDLSPRLLALPPDVRAALAGVDGPGWQVRYAPRWARQMGSPPIDVLALGWISSEHTRAGWAWWPASPAASVAAVLYPPGSPLHTLGLYYAHGLLQTRLADGDGDDHVAALSIIEAHVANRHVP